MPPRFLYIIFLIIVFVIAVILFFDFNSIASPIFKSFAGWMQVSTVSINSEENPNETVTTSDPSVENQFAISGIYPHLAIFGSASDEQKDNDGNLIYSELGIGAIHNLNGYLWVLSYPSHYWKGGNNKLIQIELGTMIMTEMSGSVGGTHAGKYYNSRLNKLFFGPYIIESGKLLKAFPPSDLPGRITGISQHISDPNSAYVYTMEQGLYTVNMNTYQVTTNHVDRNVQLNRTENYIQNPLIPGSHGKDIHTVDGKAVFIANNGKNVIGNIVQNGGLGEYTKFNNNIGLASSWNLLADTHFNDIESSSDNTNIWMLGWDTKSIILKTRNSQGVTTNLRFAKSFHNYHATHGWSTEWPRIMKITDSKYLANLYGTYVEFTNKFSAQSLGEITPKTSHLKTVNDITKVNSTLYAIAGNDLSIIKAQEKNFVKLPVSNIEFLPYSDITNSGQYYGDGALWLDQSIINGDLTDPFYIGGYGEKIVHFRNAGYESKLIVGIEVSDGTNWRELNRLQVMPGSYSYYIIQDNPSIKWLRLKSYTSNKLISAVAFLETPSLLKATNDNVFNPLVDINSADLSGDRGIIVPNDRMMEYVSIPYASNNTKGSSQLYTLGASSEDQNSSSKLLTFTKSSNPNRSSNIEQLNASRNYSYRNFDGYVSVFDNSGNSYALPISSNKYKDIPATQSVGYRRLLSDTYVLNAFGTFYTVPEDVPGAEGIINIRPISTHNKIISDFNIWRGMLVLAGAKGNITQTSHYFSSTDKTAGLWFGRVDDLYKFSKPNGYITFWKSTNTTTGLLTPPLLISGYSDKNLILQHATGKDVEFEIQVSFTARKNSSDRNLPFFHKYGKVTVKSGEKFKYNFPKGFNARWIRIKSLIPANQVNGSLSLNGTEDPLITKLTGNARIFAPIQEDSCYIYKWNTVPDSTNFPQSSSPRDIDSVILPDGRLKITLLNTAGTGLYVRYYIKSNSGWVPQTSLDSWVFRTEDLPVPGAVYRSYDHVLFPNNVLKQSALLDNPANDYYSRYLTWNSSQRSWAIGNWTKSSADIPYGITGKISSLHYSSNKVNNALQIVVKNSSDGMYYYRWLNWDASNQKWLNEPPYLTDSSKLNWYSKNLNEMQLGVLNWYSLGNMSVEQLRCIE